VYVNWTAFDELSDTVELTEALAQRQFDELLRLRARGVRLDCYLMDAFWYDPDDGYRSWRRPHWPAGPDRWLARCREQGVTPGLWVSTNSLCHLNSCPDWEDSLNRERTAMCMFDGGFLPDFLRQLQHWYERGIRVFKFDFARFDAATPAAARAHLPHEIVALNSAALRTALLRFRQHNPDVSLLAYNGFGGIQENTSRPFHQTVDLRLLDAFDALYCGDPCPADVPMMNFWRSVDVYSDHMVRQYEWNGVPLERIDNSAFMIGKTAACYRRGIAAWKGMLILSLARGGLVNTYYGNLELLDNDQATWFAKTQALFLRLQASGRFSSFGGLPGRREPYGYLALSDRGALCTAVNPSQSLQAVTLPDPCSGRPAAPERRVLFSDRGHQPRLVDDAVTLGPEQMCVVGCGAYADAAYDLGVEADVVIPERSEPLATAFEPGGHNRIGATIAPPPAGDIRVELTQSENGIAWRSRGAGPRDPRPASDFLHIEARQSGSPVPVRVQHDKVIWSGLSWAVAEIDLSRTPRDRPLEIVCCSTETRSLELAATVRVVTYATEGGSGR
jgi:hypothetical protein